MQFETFEKNKITKIISKFLNAPFCIKFIYRRNKPNLKNFEPNLDVVFELRDIIITSQQTYELCGDRVNVPLVYVMKYGHCKNLLIQIDDYTGSIVPARDLNGVLIKYIKKEKVENRDWRHAKLYKIDKSRLNFITPIETLSMIFDVLEEYDDKTKNYLTKTVDIECMNDVIELIYLI